MAERRRMPRRKAPSGSEIRIALKSSQGGIQKCAGKPVDVGEGGIGFELSEPLIVGTKVLVWGNSIPGSPDSRNARRVQVVNCRLVDGGAYRIGCAFEEAPGYKGGASTEPDAALVDYYKILQIAPTADHDTVLRVAQHLAQRFHPKNRESGNIRLFQATLQAYRVLGDPEARARYDVAYRANQEFRRKVFDAPVAGDTLESEERIRAGILAVLYLHRQRDPEAVGVLLRELENLLGVSRDRMRFALWYLTRKNYVQRDDAQYGITVEGVESVEGLYRQGKAPALSQEHRKAGDPRAA